MHIYLLLEWLMSLMWQLGLRYRCPFGAPAQPSLLSPEPGDSAVSAFLTKTIFLMDYRKVSSGYVTVGSQLVRRPETLDDLFSQPDAEPGGNPWDERVPPPGRDGTLLAIVPIPGTGTSLAIVGYAIATTSGATMSGATTNGATTTGATASGATASGATANGAGHQVRSAESDPATERRTDAGVRLDHVQRRAWAGGREIMLTFQEFQLLAFLTAHPATVFRRADLVEQVWRRDIAPAGRDTARDARAVARDSRTVDVHVSRLRQKLGPVYGRCLVTEYRVGYQFRPPAA
jgi:DNA-binding winged helix-turn-helix (wHTH) protein